MPSTFIFGYLKLKIRFCEIPFSKSRVYSNEVLDKLPWLTVKHDDHDLT